MVIPFTCFVHSPIPGETGLVAFTRSSTPGHPMLRRRSTFRPGALQVFGSTTQFPESRRDAGPSAHIACPKMTVLDQGTHIPRPGDQHRSTGPTYFSTRGPISLDRTVDIADRGIDASEQGIGLPERGIAEPELHQRAPAPIRGTPDR